MVGAWLPSFSKSQRSPQDEACFGLLPSNEHALMPIRSVPGVFRFFVVLLCPSAVLCFLFAQVAIADQTHQMVADRLKKLTSDLVSFEQVRP